MAGVKISTIKKKHSQRLSLYIGLFFILIFILLFFSSFVYPKDPTKFDMVNRFSLPNNDYLLGTDQFGRDILARIIFSTRSIFTVGIGSVFLGAILGTVLGLIAGFSPKIIRLLIMNFIDGLIAFPGILLAMLIVFLLGKGIVNTIVAIGIMMVPIYTKLTFSTIREVQPKLYIKAAKSYNLSNGRIITRYIFPILLPKLITQLTSSIAGAITIESSLSFLGLGIQPPNASIGLMLNEAQKSVLAHPYLMFPPGITLTIIILGFIFLGDALNDKILSSRGD